MAKNRVHACCEAAAHSVSDVRRALSFGTDTSEILSRTWGLQDTLGRLLDQASDEPQEVFETLSNAYPQLITEIESVLKAESRRGSMRVPAFHQSFAAIGKSLQRLQHLERVFKTGKT